MLALLVVGVGGGVWYYLSHKKAPEPPAFPAQEGADVEVTRVIEKARARVAGDPRSADAWGDLGVLFAAHGYEPEAGRCFTEAERLDPTDPRWPYYIGVFSGVHQPEEVVPHLRRALALHPPGDARSAVHLRLAEALFERQHVEEATAIFREELQRAPDNPRALFGLAQVALARGDTVAAREVLAAAAANPYARKRATIQLAALARADGDLATAGRLEEAVRQARDDPSWPDPYLRQLHTREIGQQGLLREAASLESAGQVHQATAILLEIAEADPRPRNLVSAGINLAKLRDYPRAEALLRECLRRDPSNPQGNYFLAVVLFERAGAATAGSQTERRALLTESAHYGRQAVAAKPDHGLAWLYLGRALLDLGSPAEAVEPLRQAVACRPEFVDTHLFLGEALASNGQREEAARSATSAEKLAKPGDTRPRQLLDRLGGDRPPPKK